MRLTDLLKLIKQRSGDVLQGAPRPLIQAKRSTTVRVCWCCHESSSSVDGVVFFLNSLIRCVDATHSNNALHYAHSRPWTASQPAHARPNRWAALKCLKIWFHSWRSCLLLRRFGLRCDEWEGSPLTVFKLARVKGLPPTSVIVGPSRGCLDLVFSKTACALDSAHRSLLAYRTRGDIGRAHLLRKR